MFVTLQSVFRNPSYALIAIAVGLTVFSIAVWLPNISLIATVATSDTVSLIEIVMFSLSLYGGIVTNFTISSALYTVLISILFGIYTALFVYYFRQRKIGRNSMKSTGWLGMGGIVSGLFGIGCAACGTFLLTSLATTGGAGALILWLPFDGQEFGFLGVGLLAYAVYVLCKKINDPLICTT